MKKNILNLTLIILCLGFFLRLNAQNNETCKTLITIIKLMEERKYTALYDVKTEKQGEDVDTKVYTCLYKLEGFKENIVQKMSWSEETTLYRVKFRTYEKYSKIAQDVYPLYVNCLDGWEVTEDFRILEDDIGDIIKETTHIFKKDDIEIEFVISVAALFSEIKLHIDRLNQ